MAETTAKNVEQSEETKSKIKTVIFYFVKNEKNVYVNSWKERTIFFFSSKEWSNIDQFKKTIRQQGKIKEKAIEHGLGSNTNMEVAELEKDEKSTCAYTITSNIQLREAKASLESGSKLQVNIYQQVIIFEEKQPIITVVIDGDKKEKSRKGRPAKKNELSKDDMAKINLGLEKICPGSTIQENIKKIRCGLCERNVKRRRDADVAGIVSYFHTKHFILHQNKRKKTEADGKGKEKQARLMDSTFLINDNNAQETLGNKKTGTEEVTEETDDLTVVTEVDSDLDTEFQETYNCPTEQNDSDIDMEMSSRYGDNNQPGTLDMETDSSSLGGISSPGDISSPESMNSSTDSDSDSDIEYLEPPITFAIKKADDLCIKLNRCIQNGDMDRNGILYKHLDGVLEHIETPNAPWDKDVIEFHNSIKFLGGRRTAEFLKGPISKGTGKGCVSDKVVLNFGGPSESTLEKNSSDHVIKSGFIRNYMLSFFDIVRHNESKIEPIISNESVRIFPVSIGDDGTAIKPGLQFDESRKVILGLTEPIDYRYVSDNPEPSSEFLKARIVTEVIVDMVTTLDDKMSMPISLSYVSKKGKDGDAMLATIKRQCRFVQMCYNCLIRCSTDGHVIPFECVDSCESYCAKCFELKNVCNDCVKLGHASYLPSVRACSRCCTLEETCLKCIVVVFAMDCEEGNKQGMLKLIEEFRSETHDPYLELLSILPDALHVGKSWKCSFSNWWLLVDNVRINLVSMWTLREDNGDTTSRQAARKLLSKEAVNNRDRMSWESVLELTRCYSLIKEMESSHLLSQTIIPEIRKFTTDNKVGMYPHPIAVASDDSGQFYFIDYDPITKLSALYSARFHNPVQIKPLDKVQKGKFPGVATIKCQKSVLFVLCSSAIFIVDNYDVVLITKKKLAMKKEKVIDLCSQFSIKINKTSTKKIINSTIEKHIADCEKLYEDKTKVQLTFDFEYDPTSCICAMSVTNSYQLFLVSMSQGDHSAIMSFGQMKFDGVGVTCQLVKLHIIVESATSVTDIEVSDEVIYIATKSALLCYRLDDPLSCTFIKKFETTDVFKLCLFDGGVAFTNRIDRAVCVLKDFEDGISVLAGGQNAQGCVNGVAKFSSFGQPSGICTDSGKNILVTDSQYGNVRLITELKGLSKFLEGLHRLYAAFGIKKKRERVSVNTIDDSIESVVSAASCLGSMRKSIEENSCSHKKLPKSLNGPEGFVSQKTEVSVSILVSGLKKLKKSTNMLNPNYSFNLQSCMTSDVENIHATSHIKHINPTMYEYSRSLGNTVKESLKRVSHWCVNYITTRKAPYYPIPEKSIHFNNLRQLSLPKTPVEMSVEKKKTMREWAKEYGKCVRQLTVRQQNTKYKAGTLPLNLYRVKPTGEKVDFDGGPEAPIVAEAQDENPDDEDENSDDEDAPFDQISEYDSESELNDDDSDEDEFEEIQEGDSTNETVRDTPEIGREMFFLMGRPMTRSGRTVKFRQF